MCIRDSATFLGICKQTGRRADGQADPEEKKIYLDKNVDKQVVLHTKKQVALDEKILLDKRVV